MYLSECVSEQARWLNAGLKQFTTSKACQSALGAPETGTRVGEGSYLKADAGSETGGKEGGEGGRGRKKKQPCRRLTLPTPRMGSENKKKLGEDGPSEVDEAGDG